MENTKCEAKEFELDPKDNKEYIQYCFTLTLNVFESKRLGIYLIFLAYYNKCLLQ